MTDNAEHNAFFTLRHGLPRQSPGSDATTRHLLSLAGPPPARPRVLDLGCGPGRSALLLAAEAGARAEIAQRREHGGQYGYVGYVLRPRDASGWLTRPESAADRAEVYAVNAAAFPTEAEADLVDALRADPEAWLPGLSYVAKAPDGTVAAYALLTRCHVDGAPALALAPVAVRPPYQRQGAGAAVVRAVLEAARARGERLVLVLGHPEYYPRFGFTSASGYGIRPGFEAPDEAMMALALDDSSPVPTGTIRYPAAFGV